MVRPFPWLRRGTIPLSGLTLAAILIGSFMLGHGSASGSRAKAEDRRLAANREVSRKLWISAREIEDRFSTAKHQEFMRRAIAKSRKAGVEERTGGAFGAVIVDRQGQIVAEGSNHVVSRCDPTWHGEMEAIRVAYAQMKTLKLDERWWQATA